MKDLDSGWNYQFSMHRGVPRTLDLESKVLFSLAKTTGKDINDLGLFLFPRNTQNGVNVMEM
jgi:hypothetical protein